jgi:SAM-dependent methyltransferase
MAFARREKTMSDISRRETYYIADTDETIGRLVRLAELQAPNVRDGLRRTDARPGAKVLEVGCGPIGALRELSDLVGPTGMVVGLDVDQASLERARVILDRLGRENVRLDALDLPPAILVGHSMGCRVVLQAYVNAPERVAGLVLVEGSRVGTGDPDTVEQAVRQRIQMVGYAGFLQGIFAGMFLAGSDPAIKERIVRRALALPEAIGAALFPRFFRWDAQSMDAALASVAVPMLVIQSTSVNSQGARVYLEHGASSPWLELVRRTVPAAQIDIVGGAGHFVMVEKPRAVNRHVEEFISGLRRPA